MRYELRLMDTLSGVGCFAAHPGPNLSFSGMMEHLHNHPLDDFMHQHLLFKLGEHRTRKVEKLMEEVRQGERITDPVLAALLFEACLGHERFAHLLPRMASLDAAELSRHTPAVHIRSHLLADQPLHNAWTMLMQANIVAHEPLPAPEATGLAAPYTKEQLPTGQATTAAAVRARLAASLPPAKARRPATETYAHALKQLDAKNVFLGQEMAHKASLSPVALLRMWLVDVTVKSGSMNYSLSGMQTSYGRGLDMESARASYSMEVAERVLSYASMTRAACSAWPTTAPIVRGSFEEVSARQTPWIFRACGWRCPTPTKHPLDARAGTLEDGLRPCLVPVQFVYLFANLEEQSLFSAPGSTGLASGNTLEEAKVHALGEVIERDARL